MKSKEGYSLIASAPTLKDLSYCLAQFYFGRETFYTYEKVSSRPTLYLAFSRGKELQGIVDLKNHRFRYRSRIETDPQFKTNEEETSQ